MTRASLPRIRGSIIPGPQRVRDRLVAAMRREPITWVDPLSDTGDDTWDQPYPRRWQPWVFLALVFIIVLGIVAVPVGAGVRGPDPPPPPTTQPPTPDPTTPTPDPTPTCASDEYLDPDTGECRPEIG